MINAQLEIMIIACLAAVACAIPGTFLVLRRMTMLADAISHSILLGIVCAFFFVQRIDSPILVFAAAMTGVVTVLLVEALIKTKLVKEDAAIGVVYPFMFSTAVILISLFAAQVHIDTDSVLMGELAFAPLNRLHLFGADMGPMAYYQIGSAMIANIILTILFYKEIRLAVFDEGYASALGFAPKRLLYGLMVVTSFTTVVAFEVAGTIIVVGFMVGPAVVASYFSQKLWKLLILAPLLGIAASLAGYNVAHTLDVSIAGSIITTMGIFFAAAFLFAPGKGFIAQAMKRRTLKTEFSVTLLLVHLFQHEHTGEAAEENHRDEIPHHFNWPQEYIGLIIDKSLARKWITIGGNGIVVLTSAGRLKAQNAMEQ